MAGHRSPQGTRARRAESAGPSRHHATERRPAPNGPSLRNAIVASTAAVGAVATGTFTALLPTPGDGTATTAGAAEAAFSGTLASNGSTLAELPAGAVGVLSPIAYSAPTDGASIAAGHLALLDKAATMAEELAARQAEEQRAAEQEAELDRLIAQGGVDAWIAEALQILDLPQSLAPGVKQIIMAESGGNPRAINNWDSNARRGTPSQGLMQTIPSTFAHYVHPDLAHRSITDPVANITAGVRYMIDTYGLDTLEAGGRTNSSGGYIGY